MSSRTNIGYQNDILGSDEAMKNSDSAQFLRHLQGFYKVQKREEIGELLKRDIRRQETFRDLVDHLGYTDEEFSVCLVSMFPEILNKPLLGSLRGYITGIVPNPPTIQAVPKRTLKKTIRK